MADGEQQVPNVGFTLGEKLKRKPAVSKDLKPETFWLMYEDLVMITKCKEVNRNWGAKRILDHVKLNTLVSERLARKYLSQYFYDAESGNMNFKSTDLMTGTGYG